MLRSLDEDYCICKDGYYDDESNPECKPCHYTCKTCGFSENCHDFPHMIDMDKKDWRK